MSFANMWIKISALIRFYLVGTYYTIKQLFTWSQLNVKVPELNNQNPIALITGGSKGIGLELAKLLVQSNYKLIIAARNKKDGAAAVDELKKINPKCHVEFHSVDMSKMSELKSFVDTIKRNCKKINLLINNAGVMTTPYTLVDGIELQWATNVVAPIYLCESLLYLIAKAADEDQLGRIVNVGSSAMVAQNLTKEYIESVPTDDSYSAYLAYANSKFALALYTELLQRGLTELSSPVLATCMHPGVIVTDLYRHLNPITQKIYNIPLVKNYLLRSPVAAAKDILYLCFCNDYQLSKGKYYENGMVVQLPTVDDEVLVAFKEYATNLKRSFN